MEASLGPELPPPAGWAASESWSRAQAAAQPCARLLVCPEQPWPCPSGCLILDDRLFLQMAQGGQRPHSGKDREHLTCPENFTQVHQKTGFRQQRALNSGLRHTFLHPEDTAKRALVLTPACSPSPRPPKDTRGGDAAGAPPLWDSSGLAAAGTAGHPQPHPQQESCLAPCLLGGQCLVLLGGQSLWSGVDAKAGLSSLWGLPRALHALSSGWGALL